MTKKDLIEKIELPEIDAETIDVLEELGIDHTDPDFIYGRKIAEFYWKKNGFGEKCHLRNTTGLQKRQHQLTRTNMIFY